MIEILAVMLLMGTLMGFAGLFNVSDPGEETDREDGREGDDATDPPVEEDDGDEETLPPEEDPARLAITSQTPYDPASDFQNPVIRVPAGVTEISVDLSTEASLLQYTETEWDLEYYENGLYISGPEIIGNDNAQSWTLSGSGYILRTGGGGDTVTLGNVTDVVIFAGEGDTIIGSDDHTTGRTIVFLTGGATFTGNLASVDLVLSGTGNVINGGPGNEGVLVLEGGHTLIGGEGNDRLVATPNGAFEYGATHALYNYINTAPNLLDGGEGDDLLIGSFNDTLTGGSGIDTFHIYFDPSNPAAATGGALITDFVPAVERVTLEYDSYRLGSPEMLGGELQDLMSVEEDNGDTVIIGRNGEEVLRLAGVTDLVVAFRQAGTADYVTFDGTPINPSDVDVIISPFTSDSS